MLTMATARLPGTIAQLGAAYAAAETGPAEVAAGALAACRKAQDRWNAFLNFRDIESEVRQSADRTAEGKARSQLEGVPVVVKDFYDTADVPTTAGFRHFCHRQPAKDAAMVAKLKAAGALILAKTNMDTFGQSTTGLASDFGAVINPRWPDHVPGGSSSGSAAAIAAGLVMASVDIDAAGSARLPAACCGIAAFKPTYGLLSGEGILADQPADPTILAFAHVALQARCAGDLALVLSALAGRPPAAAGRPRCAPVSNAVLHPTHSETMAKAIAALDRVARAMPAVEAPFHLAAFDASTVMEHRAAADALLFRGVDVLALPTLAEPVPTVARAQAAGTLAVRQDNVFLANYFGVPAVSIAVGRDETGLPVSLQLIGKPGADQALLALATELEASPELAD